MRQNIPLSVLLAIIGILCFESARAQTYKHKLANRSNNGVEFTLSGSSVTIEGYEGSQIIITNRDYRKSSGPTQSSPPKQAKGLHRLKSKGGSTNVGLFVVEKEGQLKFLGQKKNSGSYNIKIPDKVSVKLSVSNHGGKIEIKNMHGEIQSSSVNSNIKIQNVTGPIVASNYSGDVSITFSRLSEENPTSVSVNNGDVDLTMPENSKADLEMISISGDIYTDLPIQAREEKEGLQKMANYRHVKGTLNGGGVKLNLRVGKGNIYLRKKK